MGDTDKHSPAASARDPLAELIHAAGRRPPPPAEHYASVLVASRAAWRTKVRSRKRQRWFALAASVLVAGSGLAVYQTMQQPEPVPVATLALAVGDVALFSAETGAWTPMSTAGTQVSTTDRLRTGAAAGIALATEDGRSLRVGADSELVFAGRNSVQLLDGLLYVDSGAQPAAEPIEVETSFGTVRDIGTQFEVKATSEALRVRVRSGRVALVAAPFAATHESAAGEEFELSVDGTLELQAIAPDDDQWRWATALAVPAVENRSILSYLQWIARETGRPLRFDAPSTEQRAQLVTWSGDARGLTPLEILASISATSDFVCEVADGVIVVQRR